MKRKKGFTLTDIMITMLLISLVVIGIIRYMPTGLLASKISQSSIVAANLGEREMELLAVQSFGSIDTVPKTTTTISGYEKEITVSSPRVDLKKVTVTIYYPVPTLSGSRTIKTMKFSTYKSNR